MHPAQSRWTKGDAIWQGTRVFPSNNVLDRDPVPYWKGRFGDRNPHAVRSDAAYRQTIFRSLFVIVKFLRVTE